LAKIVEKQLIFNITKLVKDNEECNNQIIDLEKIPLQEIENFIQKHLGSTMVVETVLEPLNKPINTNHEESGEPFLELPLHEIPSSSPCQSKKIMELIDDEKKKTGNQLTEDEMFKLIKKHYESKGKQHSDNKISRIIKTACKGNPKPFKDLAKQIDECSKGKKIRVVLSNHIANKKYAILDADSLTPEELIGKLYVEKRLNGATKPNINTQKNTPRTTTNEDWIVEFFCN